MAPGAILSKAWLEISTPGLRFRIERLPGIPPNSPEETVEGPQ